MADTYAPGQLPGPRPRWLAAGDSHSLVVRAPGTVWAWGSNALGQVGDGRPADLPSPARALLPGNGSQP